MTNEVARVRRAQLRQMALDVADEMRPADTSFTTLLAMARGVYGEDTEQTVSEQHAASAASPASSTPAKEQAGIDAVADVEPTPAPHDARRGYAIELARTIGRYASDHEAAILVEALETVKSTVLRTRHCPGLNDASYDLYSRFFLQTAGGKQ